MTAHSKSVVRGSCLLPEGVHSQMGGELACFQLYMLHSVVGDTKLIA